MDGLQRGFLAWLPQEKHEAPSPARRCKHRFTTGNFLCDVLSRLRFLTHLLGLRSAGLKVSRGPICRLIGVDSLSGKRVHAELVVEISMDDLAVRVIEMTGLLIIVLIDSWLLRLRLRLVVVTMAFSAAT